jgi:aspartate dehydrogenase
MERRKDRDLRTIRVALIGFGAIGKPITKVLVNEGISGLLLVAILRRRADDDPVLGVVYPTSLGELIDLAPDLVVEVAGGQAFKACVPPLLEKGIDVLAVSLAALADSVTEENIRRSNKKGGGRLLMASGAIGGLDALVAAREGGLDVVEITQSKPLSAFPDEDLSGLQVPRVMSRGSAREAALAFPKNANISAAVALAGIGFDSTRVSIVADPSLRTNHVELFAAGAFGQFRLSMDNRPSDENPRTSGLVAYSVLASLRRLSDKTVILI